MSSEPLRVMIQIETGESLSLLKPSLDQMSSVIEDISVDIKEQFKEVEEVWTPSEMLAEDVIISLFVDLSKTVWDSLKTPEGRQLAYEIAKKTYSKLKEKLTELKNRLRRGKDVVPDVDDPFVVMMKCGNQSYYLDLENSESALQQIQAYSDCMEKAFG